MLKGSEAAQPRALPCQLTPCNCDGLHGAQGGVKGSKGLLMLPCRRVTLQNVLVSAKVPWSCRSLRQLCMFCTAAAPSTPACSTE